MPLYVSLLFESVLYHNPSSIMLKLVTIQEAYRSAIFYLIRFDSVQLALPRHMTVSTSGKVIELSAALVAITT